ncbi:hypothetical protein [Desulforhabdus amnigena]|uniref:Uncharacterized protein n=1 Tax=Desulforhabdus amnigena TaxID=40218 RepID=A0A9W6CW99_9BACT|nr:hypothetical protein [Desulforhabdus amnigena]GLI33031.1 hypothetical protein DAMNIGENAA_04640 [Desulforhabdus amnigena]
MLKYTFIWVLVLVSMAFFLVGVYRNIVANVHAEMFAAPLMMKGGITFMPRCSRHP